MYDTNGAHPQYAYLIEDPSNPEMRELFKCRIVDMSGEYYNQAINGLMDTGAGAVITTKKPIKYKKGMLVIMDDIQYSVQSIRPYIPDTVAQTVRKKKNLTEYLITLV